MPNQRQGTIADVHSFARAKKLYKPVEELEKRVENGEDVTVVESSFSDPGDDYTALHVGNECVGYWQGF